MLKAITRLIALLLTAVLVSTAAAAQTSTSTVEGTISDEQGAILPGATATLTGPRGDVTVQTDDKGMYRFIGVLPGTYTLKVDLGTTFAPQTREVIVGLGKTAVVDFTMKMATLAETVNVVGSSTTVDVKSTATDNTVVLPEWTRIDAALYYNITSLLRAQVNIENLFDEDYYVNAHSNTNITPGSPRAVRVALTTRF